MINTDPGVLEARLRQRERQLDAVIGVAQSLQSQLDLHDLLRQAALAAMATVEAEAGSILLHDPDRSLLVFRHVEGPTKATVTGLEIADTQGIAGEVFHTGQARISHDVTVESAHATDVDLASGYHTVSMITVPLRAYTGEAIGVLQMLNKRAGAFDEEDLAVLQVLAAQVASAIVTAQLFERAKASAIVDLLGQLSHDIKNLLTPVSMAGQTLRLMLDDFHAELGGKLLEHCRADEPLATEIRASILRVQAEVGEIFDILDESTDIAQQRAKELADSVKGLASPPSYEPTDLDDLVTGVCRVLQVVAEPQGVTLVMDRCGTPTALLDGKRLYNALYNLVHNAIAATPPGGTVTIRTAVRRACGQLEISVSDTGAGMPPDTAAALFTTGVRSTKPGGTGLGSRVVKNVVEAHGGTLTVDTAQGQGTTITARLPLRAV